MALGKIGTTIGKEIIAWTKTSGSKSLLAARSVKINPESLGYVHPSGEIIFQSSDAALNFARNQVLKALKSKKPYEKAVILKDNAIKGVFNGNEAEVGIPIFSDKGLTVVHGHPTSEFGVAPCISIPDAKNLIMGLSDYERVIAYNAAGEFSQLSTTPIQMKEFSIDLKLFTQISKKFKDVKKDEIFTLNNKPPKCNHLKQITTQAMMDSISTNFRNFILRGKPMKQIEGAYKKEDYKLAEEILHENQTSSEGVKKVDQFWKKFANIYGLEYKTNYSYLK